MIQEANVGVEVAEICQDHQGDGGCGKVTQKTKEILLAPTQAEAIVSQVACISASKGWTEKTMVAHNVLAASKRTVLHVMLATTPPFSMVFLKSMLQC
jgi:hypothetical protein